MRPKIMGILNVTPDSFSDGGLHFEPTAAVQAGLTMRDAGAEIIDVGGESTRPGAEDITVEEELRRVIPVVEALARDGVPVSIDTRKAEVMRAAIDAGAIMVNDISALTADPDSLMTVADTDAQIVLMHMRGTPATMQSLAEYDDVLVEVLDWLKERIAICMAAGISKERLIADPGIGFSKRAEHNLALLQGLESFHELGVQILLAASRKSLINDVAGPVSVDARLPGSLALALRGADAGVDMLRVHDVPETLQALELWSRIQPL